MESMKDWLLGICREASTNAAQPKSQTKNYVNKIVTPRNIPEFTIPGMDPIDPELLRRLSDTPDAYCNSQSSESLCSSPRLSPVMRGGSSTSLAIPNVKHSKSAPVSPIRSSTCHSIGDKDCLSVDHIHRLGDDTNADPNSAAAMGLAHLKSRTSFGFSTLSEIPHTTRRESLFHPLDDNSVCSSAPTTLVCRGGRRKAKSRENINEITRHKHDAHALRRTASLTHSHGNRSNIPFLVEPKEGQIKENTPRTSPLALSPSSDTQTDNSQSPDPAYFEGSRFLCENAFRRSSRRNRLYYRRRSSLPGLDPEQTKHLQMSGSDSHTDDASSNESSPSFRRRSNGTIEPYDPITKKRHSNPTIGSTDMGCHKQIVSSKSTEAISKLQAQLIAEQGEIKISFKYLPATRQLCVVLIRAENLGGSSRSDHCRSTYAKICLMPGKVQKQTSDVVKNTNKPTFNQEFFFKDLWMEELNSMRIRIQMFNKGNLRRDEFIGETQVALASFSLLQDNRMWKDLEPKVQTMDLGYIEAGLRFDPKASRLVVSVVRASDLSPHSARIAPNPYVKIELSEPGRHPVKKQTPVHKKNKSPIFQNYFEFTISPKLDDLNYTSVTFTIYDHEKLRSDDVIGEVRLGYGATEKNEHAHWQRMLLNPEKEIVEWHPLMEIENVRS